MAQSDSDDDREQIDIAVVGAGVAGTYCCWRLQAAQNGRKAVLFEMSKRIGGRLWSVPIPSIPGVMGELGGMRFLSLQRMVVSLTKYLGLPTSDFPMGGPLNIATLRGVRLRNAAFEYPQIVPYRLLPGEQGHGPGDLLVKAIETVIPNATKLTPQQWEDVKQTTQWNGDYLYNWGLWNVLLSKNSTAAGNPSVLSSEAYDMLFDGGGYESLVDNWNCAEAFEYLLVDFPREAKYLQLPKGYHTLPQKLAEKFTGDGGKIYMEHRLTQVRHPAGQWRNGDRSRRRGRAEQADASLSRQGAHPGYAATIARVADAGDAAAEKCRGPGVAELGHADAGLQDDCRL